MARQRLLRALLSTLGDDAAAGIKLRALHATRLLLAAFANGGAAARENPDDANSTGSRRRGDGSGGGGSKGGSSVAAAAAAAAAAAGLSEEDWAAAVKKLGKRLEDGDDAIRIAACGALAELARCRVAGPGFSARQDPLVEADAKLGGALTKDRPNDRPDRYASGLNGNNEQAAEGPSAVEKLLSSLRLHACDDNPAVAAAAAAVVQQLQSSDLDS